MLEIEVTNEYKYLGIYFKIGGAFAKAKQHIAEQANKALFSLLKKIRALSLPLDRQPELFDKTIKPILWYGTEVWGFGKCDVIERVHLKFLKYIFKLKKINTITYDIWWTGHFPYNSKFDIVQYHIGVN